MTKYKHTTLIDHIYLSNINNILNLCIDLRFKRDTPKRRNLLNACALQNALPTCSATILVSPRR